MGMVGQARVFCYIHGGLAPQASALRILAPRASVCGLHVWSRRLRLCQGSEILRFWEEELEVTLASGPSQHTPTPQAFTGEEGGAPAGPRCIPSQHGGWALVL